MKQNKVIIHQSEVDFIKQWILEYPNLETGGDLFGYWSKDGNPVVEFVIGPGKNARRTSTSFFQDIAYLKIWGELINGMDSRLHHIGAWHSHHTMSLARPSGGDINTMRNALRGKLDRFLISIGNINGNSSVTVNGFLFVKNLPDDYLECDWSIKNGTSLIRQKLNRDPNLENIDIQADRKVGHFEKDTQPTEIKLSSHSVEKPTFIDGSFWVSPEGQNLLKKAFETISASMHVANPEILQLEDTRLVISFLLSGSEVRIILPNRYPKEPIDVAILELNQRWGLIGSLFGAERKLENRLSGIIYRSGLVKKESVIIIKRK